MKLRLLATMALLGGCVQYSSRVPPIVVNVTSEGGTCRVTVALDAHNHPVNFTQVHQDQLRQIGRNAKSHRAIVIYDLNAEYKCIGATIIAAQQAGLLVEAVPWNHR